METGTHLVTEQLVDDAQYFGWQKRPLHVVTLVQGVSGGQAAAVHLGVHNL